MDSQSSPLVSVVTPVHNEEEYLSECIESVLSQTYQNWEYTIIDNCSSDKSLQIARRYAAKDNRVRVLENPQLLPALANFNRAIREIAPASKYCKPVFGDDWIFPECLERMVAVAEEHPSIGIVSAYALEGEKIKCVGLPAQSTFFLGREICRKHFLEGIHVFGTLTNVLYRSDLVRCHTPFFNETNIHADTEACFVLLKTSDFGFVHQVLTFSRVRLSSRSVDDADNETDYGGFLETLVKHGSAYLSQNELTDRVNQHVSGYYAGLGKGLMLGRDKKFWDYHKAKLTEAGVGFSHVRVAGAALAILADALANPKSSVEKLLRRGRNRNRTQTPASNQIATSGMEDWAVSHRQTGTSE